MSREICKNSSKMYHFLNKIQNLPEMNQEFSYIFYTFLKNLPEMEEKSPSFHFQTHHMYVIGYCYVGNANGSDLHTRMIFL